MLTRVFGIVAVVSIVCGCYGEFALKSASSGYVGCTPEEITILRDDPEFGSRAWELSCHGRRWMCSGAGQTMSCRPLNPDPPPGPPARPPGTVDNTATPATSTPPQRAWRLYSSSACGYSVRMPAQVEETEQSESTPAGPVTTRIAAAQLGPAAEASISCADIPKRAKEADPEKLLDGARDGAKQRSGLAIVDEKHAIVQDYPARELVLRGPTGDLRLVAIVANRRLYVLTAQGLGNDELTTLRQSFRILPPVTTDASPHPTSAVTHVGAGTTASSKTGEVPAPFYRDPGEY